MSSKDKSKESKERDTVTNRRESVGWSKGPSLEVIPAAAKHAPAWGAGHVFERVAVDGRTELAAASGEELRGGGVSTGWADPQTNNVTGYAINPELQLDPNLRAHGGWRGHLACQRDTPEYEIATRIISNAAQITAEIRHEPDCLDCNWRWRDRNSLLKLLLTGAEGILSEEDADNLCTLATACGQVLRDQETVVDVPAPCKVFGDTHGQLRSLLLLFGAFGFPHHGAGDATSYIFNGDFVDRGLHQLEVVAILFALKLMYPERVYLLRGNHEFRDMNEKMGEDGFLSHCESRLGAVTPGRWGRIYDAIHASFDLLPLAARIGGAVLVLHGGVGDGSWDLDTLQSIKRPLQELEWDEEASKKLEARAVLHAMWSDPSDSDAGMRAGVHLGQRGGSIPEFGPDITKRFCERNGVEVVIRSHQFVKEGFKLMHSGHLLTVFSARDYFVDTDLFDRDVGNDAALLLLAPDRNGDLRIHPKRISSCVSGIEAAVRTYRRNSGGSAWTRAFAWLVTCGASSRSIMR